MPLVTTGERLAILETYMEDIAGGNGRTGRMEKIEKTVRSHDKLIWIGWGILIVIHFLESNGLLNWARVIKQ